MKRLGNVMVLEGMLFSSVQCAELATHWCDTQQGNTCDDVLRGETS